MTDRTMVHFPVGGRLFNYRVAAVAIRDGHVLLCREYDDDHTMLPGGRVELGESTLAALRREIAEELRAPAEIERLLITAEDFFSNAGRQVHEIAAYYLIDLSPEFPFDGPGRAREVWDGRCRGDRPLQSPTLLDGRAPGVAAGQRPAPDRRALTQWRPTGSRFASTTKTPIFPATSTTPHISNSWNAAAPSSCATSACIIPNW